MSGKKPVIHLYNGILHNQKQEGAPTLHANMDGSGDHYANEISQAVKDKFHVMSPISGT